MTESSPDTRPDDVVITGLGLVSPLGVGSDAVWESLREMRSGVVAQPDWPDSPLRLAAPVADTFEPKQLIKPRKSLKVMCREIQLGVAAAELAVQDAQFDISQCDRFRIGVVLGTDIMHCPPADLADTYHACMTDNGFSFENWYPEASRNLNPLWMLKYLPNMAASHIAIAQDAQGHSNTLVMSDVSGLLAVMEAADVVASGRADAMFAGGSGYSMSLTTLVYHGSDRLSQRIADPITTPRPFDSQRDGTVIGEGAGVVLLERREAAEKRGANILASIAGYSRRMDFRPHEHSSQALTQALSDSLRRAGIAASALDHINATGRGSIDADIREAVAVREVAGDCPVFAPSSYFGTLSAAGSVVEWMMSLVAARAGFRGATLNHDETDPRCPVRVAREVVPLERPWFAKLATTSNGQAASLVTRMEM